MKTKLLGLYFSVFASIGVALPNTEVSDFTLWRTDKGKVLSKKFVYDALKPSASFRAKSPHGMLNPEGKVEEWSGNTVRSLFQEFGVKPQETRTEVVILGTDGYLAQMEMKDFFSPDAIVATHMNGEKINPSKGGPQLFFPNQDATLPNELKFEGWGVWYVAAFVIGELPGRLTLTEPSGKSKDIALSYKTKQTRTTPKYYPPGHFRTPFATDPVRMGIVNLKEWIAASAKEPFGHATAYTYYGGKVPIKNDLSEYDLVVAWNDGLIPPKFGGPAQICPKGKISQCTFLVREIVLEK